MATVPPPSRPPVPGRPPVPSPSAKPPGATVPAVTAPVTPTATVPAPVVPAPVVPAPVVPPVTNAPTNSATDSTSPATTATAPAGTVPPVTKKRGKPKRDLTPWAGCFVYADVAGADGVAVPTLQYDSVTGANGVVTQVPRRQKIEGVPQLTADGGADGWFDVDKNEALKPRDFKKLGDYFRFQNAIYTMRAEKALADAKAADEGKRKTRTAGAGKQAEKLQAQMQQLLTILASQMDHATLAAKMAELGIAAPAAPVVAS